VEQTASHNRNIMRIWLSIGDVPISLGKIARLTDRKDGRNCSRLCECPNFPPLQTLEFRMKNTRDIPSNDAIAFTRNCFETLAIEDFDVAAPIADHTGILQHTCGESSIA
jgi:hypothetical protein